MSAAAHANISVAPPERGELLPTETRSDYSPEDVELVKQTRMEVDRYRSMDRLIPSPHNIVTVAALEVSFITLSDPIHYLYVLVVLYDSRRSQPCLQPSEGILPLHTVRNNLKRYQWILRNMQRGKLHPSSHCSI